MSFSKNVDLKPILVYSDPKELVGFHSIVVPSSMRSPLWKYFGFPADENKEIITKNRIVCGICHAYIAYNKNTTNLSTHLNCKHPEILSDLNANKQKPAEYKVFATPIRLKRDSSPSPSPSTSKRSKMTEEKYEIDWYASDDVSCQTKEDAHPTGITDKVCIQGKRSTYKTNMEQINNRVVILKSAEINDLVIDTDEQDHENQYIETIDYNNIDINEDDHEIISEELETESTVNASSQSKDEFLSGEFLTMNEHNEVLYQDAPKEVVIASKSPPKIAKKIDVNIDKQSHDPLEVLEHIKKFIIKDLVTPKMIDGSGFKELIAFLSQCTDIPTSTQIEKSIEKEYNTQHSGAITGIKSIVNTRNYSLSFHKLGNSEMIEISVNFWSDIGNRIGSLENQIFCISKNCTNFVNSFAGSLKRCSAFVVDFDLGYYFDGDLPENIPIIPTFSYVTKMAFDASTNLSVVKIAIESVDDILMGKIKASHTWLQQFETLSQFLNDSASTEYSQIIQVLIECLQPLKNCLDVLAFETSAYASIMKPLALQLIGQNYSDIDSAADSSDSDLVVLEKDLKRTIHEILQQHVIENRFLTMASFLDPRFQNLTAPNDSQSIRDELEKVQQNIEGKPEQKIDDKIAKSKQERSFGLSSLFSNISTATKSKTPKNRFDMEFRSYTEDVSLNMELCPLEWWFASESMYPTIKQHVKKYFCVPSFVNNFHRLPMGEQEELESKYDRIGSDTNEKLLWLHLNELRQRSSEA